MNCKTCKNKKDGYCYGKTFLNIFPNPMKVADDFCCRDYEKKVYDCDIYLMNFLGVINHKLNDAFFREIEPIVKKYGLSMFTLHDPEHVKKIMDDNIERLKKFRKGGSCY